MIDEIIKRYPCLSACEDDIQKATDEIISCYEKGGKLLLCGNGGSAADCEHISGELLKGFLKKRALSDEELNKMEKLCPESKEIAKKLQGGLPAIPLTSLMSLNTAFSNDEDSDLIYAQGVMAMHGKDDLVLCLSTSGNSKNVVAAAITAKALGLKIVALTGNDGGKLKELADVAIVVPEKETFKIQELHLPVYHYICATVEERFFG